MNTAILKSTALCLAVLALVSCESKTKQPKTPQTKNEPITNTIKKTNDKTKQPITRPQDSDVSSLLDNAVKRRQQDVALNKMAAHTHYKIARQIYLGTVELKPSDNKKNEGLNKARKYLITAIHHDSEHKNARALLTRVESALGIPASEYKDLLENAHARYDAEEQQKNAEIKIKYDQAHKLMEAGRYEEAIRILNALKRQLDD